MTPVTVKVVLVLVFFKLLVVMEQTPLLLVVQLVLPVAATAQVPVTVAPLTGASLLLYTHIARRKKLSTVNSQ